jgi:hypothetical protein
MAAGGRLSGVHICIIYIYMETRERMKGNGREKSEKEGQKHRKEERTNARKRARERERKRARRQGREQAASLGIQITLVGPFKGINGDI